MTTTKQQKDEDLFIIKDSGDSIDFGAFEETNSSEGDDFSFTIEEDNDPIILEEVDNNIEKNDINELELTLEEDISKEKIEESETTKNDLLDFMGDLSQKSEELEKKETNNIDQEKKLDENLNLDLGFTEDKKEVSDLKESKNTGDMSEILGRTIKEFEDREVLIESDISEKEKHIFSLEKELDIEKKIVSDLKDEKTAIEKNRKSIEKMKSEFENRDIKK